jgi:hypothetical protein
MENPDRRAKDANTLASVNCGMADDDTLSGRKWSAMITPFFLIFCSAARADDLGQSHCKPSEHTFLHARMVKAVEGTYLGDDTGKTLSLCADTKSEPIGKLVYRYGAIGRVEMEQIATRSHKFWLSTMSDPDAHAGEILISFSHNKIVYEVGEGMGMKHGVFLYVYKGRDRILNLISEDLYESDMSSLNLDKAASPIFKIVKPLHPW